MIQEQYDLIVIGSGAAGLAAASTAAIEGRSVLLLEHADRIGGTTAISGGMVWIPANHKMSDCGLVDSQEAAWRYIEQTVPSARKDPRMQEYVLKGDKAIRYLEAHTQLKLRPVIRYPDYYPDLEGATAGGRVLEPVPFDGRQLGQQFTLLRDPLPEFMLFGSMMIGREDIPKLRRIGTSLSATWYSCKLFARHAKQRIRSHRGTSLVLGNALAARLYKSASDLGVKLVLNARIDNLIFENNRVVGVEGSIQGQHRRVLSKSGVILATGGISHDTVLRRSYVPDNAGQTSATVNSKAGTNGARLALATGASLSQPISGLKDALAFWVPVSTWKRPDGTQGIFPHTVTDRSKPGLIAVNRLGKRFTNEAASYHEFVRAQLQKENQATPAWLICDSKFLWKYGLGRVRPFAVSTRREIQSGYLKTANSIEGLAAAIDVPPQALTSTVKRYNTYASNGLDPEFHRGENIYQQHLGDSDHQPNPCVASILCGPFYAVSVSPADLGMSAGIRTDAHARVLRSDDTLVEGLFACGNDMESVMRGAYPGPGITLGPALVFGVIAGRQACGRPL